MDAFETVSWSEAQNRKDMNALWSRWVEAYNTLVDKLIGTRLARESSWGRAFDRNVRALCKKASISRGWYIQSHQMDQANDAVFTRWVNDRQAFITAWEKSKRDWLAAAVTKAVKKGDIAIWRLLNGNTKKTFRPLVKECSSILTDPCLIADELSKYYLRSLIEISSVVPGEFDPVRWDEDFIMKESPEGDLILKFSDALVLVKVKKMKLSTVTDAILPPL